MRYRGEGPRTRPLHRTVRHGDIFPAQNDEHNSSTHKHHQQRVLQGVRRELLIWNAMERNGILQFSSSILVKCSQVEVEGTAIHAGLTIIIR